MCPDFKTNKGLFLFRPHSGDGFEHLREAVAKEAAKIVSAIQSQAIYAAAVQAVAGSQPIDFNKVFEMPGREDDRCEEITELNTTM